MQTSRSERPSVRPVPTWSSSVSPTCRLIRSDVGSSRNGSLPSLSLCLVYVNHPSSISPPSCHCRIIFSCAPSEKRGPNAHSLSIQRARRVSPGPACQPATDGGEGEEEAKVEPGREVISAADTEERATDRSSLIAP